jgi:hypothetical protein
MPFREAMGADMVVGAKLYRGGITKPPAEGSIPIILTEVSGTTAKYTGTTGAHGSGIFVADEKGVTMTLGTPPMPLRLWVAQSGGRRRKTRRRRHGRKTRRVR